MKPTRIAVLALTALLALTVPVFGQSNQTTFLSPDKCQMTATTTAFTTGPALLRAAAGNLVLSGTTNTTAGTVTVTCNIGEVAGRLGSAFRINSINVFYGLQTTAMASIAAGSVQRVTYAASTAAGAAAAGTVSSALGGTLTVTPTVLQLTTTTSGQFFNEMIRFGTPVVVNQNSQISFEQVFTTAGTTATTLQIAGIQVNYTIPNTSSSVN